MRNHEIENWALRIVESTQRKQEIEDSRVELKSNWIEPQKAARQIAGHANSARSDEILWLIGLDENKGVIGASHQEFSIWWSQVKSQFDGIYPSVTDLNVSVSGATIVALLFDTSRIPYVVKNPTFNKEGRGPVELEVPWREGRSTRSARREDLIKILTPFSKLPDFEVLDGELTALDTVREKEAEAEHVTWYLRMSLYVTPLDEEMVVLPFHRCQISAKIEGIDKEIRFDRIRLGPSQRMLLPSYQGTITTETDSYTIAGTSSEVIIQGPGEIKLSAEAQTEPLAIIPENGAKIILALTPTRSDKAAVIIHDLHREPFEKETSPLLRGKWGSQ